MNKVKIAEWSELDPETPIHALVGDVDLVIVRWPGVDEVSVLYGRCLHRGALLSDGTVKGEDLICGVHNWDYRYKTGVSAYSNSETLNKFTHWIENGGVFVDEDEIAEWELSHPEPYDREAYQGAYADPHGTDDEPFNSWIHELAENGTKNVGPHGR
ncbi:MAG: Rieske 2Fe-2S domain-containing protein, partial [Myxococcales bacterium]|nr:Rieske 2Fe-2S domain-containing protein [Myxococcales bacterium]